MNVILAIVQKPSGDEGNPLILIVAAIVIVLLILFGIFNNRNKK